MTIGARPVHVLYGGAHLYKAESAAKLGKIARASLDAVAKSDAELAALVDMRDPSLAAELCALVREKLDRESIESICIDFEDGYGPRPDEEEDADATRTAQELARARAVLGAERPIVGIRIKSLEEGTRRRALRTLDLFVTTLAQATSGALTHGFTVTLPKVARPSDVAFFVDILGALESKLGIESGRIAIEIMVETPRTLVDAEGRVALPAIVAAARGRCVAAHLGAYDLTAALGVAATAQRLAHPACELARVLMQIALADTGVAVVDGATTLLPLGDDPDARRRAWVLHAAAVSRALDLGIYQGWDLHPAQIPARYAALYAFFLAERAPMAARLESFVKKSKQATRSGQVFDDAATGRGLVSFFLRGVACGALSEADLAPTGMSLDEVRALFDQDLTARSTTASGETR
ncbi:MAG: phosphoenolpyruvate kinase [Labilithrix sp.]|nr:phosphoenolpyruvate kinase [Labilithrix sp.]